MTGATPETWRPLAALVEPVSVVKAELYAALVGDLVSHGLAVAVTGGLARGDFDTWSDLDLVVLTPSGDDLQAVHDALDRLDAEVVAGFGGEHLGRPRMLVRYLSRGGEIVKVDVETLAGSRGGRCDLRWLAKPDVVAEPDVAGAAQIPVPALVELVEERAVGWLWFCATRVLRGELFAASRAIDQYREDILLPLLLERLGLPQDGHRRVEQRLPPDFYAALRRTFCPSLDGPALSASLLAVGAWTVAEFAYTSPEAARRADAMLERVRHELTAVSEDAVP